MPAIIIQIDCQSKSESAIRIIFWYLFGQRFGFWIELVPVANGLEISQHFYVWCAYKMCDPWWLDDGWYNTINICE